MTIAQFQQPDFTTQTAAQYKANIDASIALLSGIGRSFAPHQSSTPDMTVTLDPGLLATASGLISQSSQVTAPIVAPSSNPRIDRVVINAATGVVSVVTGTESANPSAPAVPADRLPVCQVLLQTTDTAIYNGQITDERAGMTTPGGFPSGTKMLFQQTTAPTGWTKDTTHNDKALRVVSGVVSSGGSSGFSVVFGAGVATGSGGGHSHTYSGTTSGPDSLQGVQGGIGSAAVPAHTHSFSGTTANDPGHTHSLSMDIQYVDVIIASKD